MSYKVSLLCGKTKRRSQPRLRRNAVSPPNSLYLPTLLRFHRCFGSLETNLRVGAVAERLIDGGAAAAERDRLLPRQVVFVAFSISKLNLAEISFYQVRSISLRQN